MTDPLQQAYDQLLSQKNLLQAERERSNFIIADLTGTISNQLNRIEHLESCEVDAKRYRYWVERNTKMDWHPNVPSPWQIAYKKLRYCVTKLEYDKAIDTAISQSQPAPQTVTKPLGAKQCHYCKEAIGLGKCDRPDTCPFGQSLKLAWVNPLLIDSDDPQPLRGSES